MLPEQFITAYELALASQQWKNVEPLMHANACVTFSTGTVHKGIEAIKQAYEKNFSHIKNERYSVTNVHWVTQNNETAVYLFNFHWQGIINGEQAAGSGKGTAVIIFEDEKWKLIAEHLGA
ncbi:MAG: nuclear transport factor 2 family protein [Bacteroidetes bacterium]|nr:nuclear transport factor 2 family protein [Bacteroidota bacterium]